LTQAKGESEARTARNQPFRSRNGKWITQGESLGEIVVDRPAQTRAADGDYAKPIRSNRAALIAAEHHQPQKNQPTRSGLAPTKMLPEDGRSEHDRERGLKVQEERRTDGRRPLQTPEQEHRA